MKPLTILTVASLMFGLMSTESLFAQRSSLAIAELGANGVVTRITVTDGGAGYTVSPGVTMGGGGGSGASARASILNGVVVEIQLVSGGAGYTNAPSVAIDPPDTPVSTLDVRLIPQITLYAEMGSTQEVQMADTLQGNPAWLSLGPVVVANSSWFFYDTNASSSSQRYYRAVARGHERPPTPAGMVWLPPGTFVMGSPLSDLDFVANEGPPTEVRLTQGFFLGRCEVTQGEYAGVMGANPSTFTGDSNRPVETVTWAEAATYCARLTQREQAAGRIPATWRYRLPTEAEWEYAARAGGTNRYSFAEAEVDGSAWQAGNSRQTTHPVGQLRPNAWGIFDLAGNVAEWCGGVYGDYSGGVVADPLGASAGQARVVRGGSGVAPQAFGRAAARDVRQGAAVRDGWVGFRVALAYVRPEPLVDQTPVGGAISGSVRIKGTALPVSGVMIYLVDTNHPVDAGAIQNNRSAIVAATVTGQDGRYWLGSVKPGHYVVAAQKADAVGNWPILPEDLSNSPVLIVSNETRTVNFTTEDPLLWETLRDPFHVYIHTIAYWFQADHFYTNKALALAARIRSSTNAPEQYLRAQLPTETLAMLSASTNAGAVAAVLARDFNQIILNSKGDIYDGQTQLWLAPADTQAPQNPEISTRQIRWRNRNFLQSAFTNEIMSVQKKVAEITCLRRIWILCFPIWVEYTESGVWYNVLSKSGSDAVTRQDIFKGDCPYGVCWGVWTWDNCLSYAIVQTDALSRREYYWTIFWPLDKTPVDIHYEWDMETHELVLRAPAGRTDHIIWQGR
jgi:formylglycine-generating enzyme required for sulfatase activity